MQRIRARHGVLLSVSLFTAAAAQPDLRWVEQSGTSDADLAMALAPDGAGGVFAVGSTKGDFAGPNAGSKDILIVHYGNAGNILWARQIGTLDDEEAQSAAPDGVGGVFVAGSTSGSLARPNPGGNDAFLARYDGDGNQKWLVQFGADHEDDGANSVTPDGAGGMFVGGFAQTGQNLDAFVARYDDAGNRIWFNPIGTETFDIVSRALGDGQGGVFVVGILGDFGGQNAGDLDGFVAHYDGAGQQLWVEQMGSEESDIVESMATDGAGGVFIVGETLGSVGGRYAGAGHDIFLARYDAAGVQQWITQFGTLTDDSGPSMTSDAAGGVLIAGITKGNFGGQSQGLWDCFLTGYDGAGQQKWAAELGTSKNDWATDLTPAGAGDYFLSGFTVGDLGGPNAGEQDIFLARIGFDCPVDLNADGELDLFDFLAFVNLFNVGDPAADCDQSGTLDLFDFLCFTNAFNAGC